MKRNLELFEKEIISLRKAGKSLREICEWLKDRNIIISKAGLKKWLNKRNIFPVIDKDQNEKFTEVNENAKKELAVNLLDKFLLKAEELLENGKIKITADSILKAINLKLTGNIGDKGEQILLQIFQGMNIEEKKDATVRLSEKLLERLQPIQDSIKSETDRNVNNNSNGSSEFGNSKS